MYCKSGLCFLVAVTVYLSPLQLCTADEWSGVVCGVPFGFTKCGESVPEQTDCSASENGGVCLYVEEVVQGITYLVPKCTISGQTYHFYMADYTTNYNANASGGYLETPWERTKKACFVEITCGENCSWDFMEPPRCSDGGFGNTGFINVVQSADGDCVNGVWTQP